MRALLEAERPWIELFHPEDYALTQGWLHNVKATGLSGADLEVLRRRRARSARSGASRGTSRCAGRPTRSRAGVVLLVVPGVATYLRERH